MVTVKLEHSKELDRLFGSGVKEVRRQGHIILGRAISRAATTGITKASVSIRKEYIIKASDVKRRIKIRKSTANNLSAQLRASGPVTPLMKFDVTPSFPDVMQVRARVKKGGRKPIQNGFVTRTGNGHMNVFTRIGRSRLPIQGRYGPSVAQMMGKDEVVEDIEMGIQDTLDKRLEHELGRLLRGEF